MKDNLQKIIEQFVDFLMPVLTPYEASLYIFFLRNSFIKSNSGEIRIGQIAIENKGLGSSHGGKTHHTTIKRLVKGLEGKGCIKIGDTNRDGTLYNIFLPEEIPSVKEKLAITADPVEEDFFTNPEKRKEIFERDKYTCFYCGEKVTPENSTLDHLVPQSKDGKHTKENLKTSCLICNSIKSGKTYEDAAPYLLKSIQERRNKK